MAKQIINIGTSDLAGDGESIRTAFDKINDNFDELYASRVVSSLTDISVETQAAADGGALSYDSVTGVITYTPPDLTNLTNYATQNDLSLLSYNLNGLIATQVSTLQGQVSDLTQNKVGINTLKSIIAASTDFADFQQRVMLSNLI